MRGYKDLSSARHAAPVAVAGQVTQIGGDAVKILTDISNELKATREALEKIAQK
jgi:hypothetical protein